jgi:two-component system sensor histidine kinase YesM
MKLAELVKSSNIYKILEKKSFRGILIFSFVFVSILPILFLQFVSYNRLGENLQNNINRFSVANAAQIKSNLQLILDSYSDLLYQIYTNDDVVLLARNIDEGNNRAVSVNQLRRLIHGLCYAKDGIEAISIITQGGNVIYYDKITASNVNSSWLGRDGLTSKVILEKMLDSNSMSIFPTSYASNNNSIPYYLFHITHRIIDYIHIESDIGIIVLSINEEILREACNANLPQGTFSFIVDKNGRIITYPDRKQIGRSLPNYVYNDENISQSSYKSLLLSGGYLARQTEIFSSQINDDWIVVNVIDQDAFYREIRNEQIKLLISCVIILLISILLILGITGLLARSMDTVTSAMEKTQKGDLSVSITEKKVFSSEMIRIVRTFNEMMLQIKYLIEEVKAASLKQKDAEIRVLEAQINPHFLYNTLDTINWTAIDNDQLEISKMLSSLAKILRYSINNSNKFVPLKEELEWLDNYIHLQQMRSKNNFDYNFEIDESALDYPVHKLILQPFVENSIKHGFKDTERKNLLNVIVRDSGDNVKIFIHDNGVGMTATAKEEISNETQNIHIGIKNARERLQMYYGDNASVEIESRRGYGTTVILLLKKSYEY